MPVPYWDDQRILLAVLRAGSLLGAARALDVSQPTIRRRIEALEVALGVALFTRCAAAVVPTQTALDLVPHLEAMERASSAFQRGVSADANALAGTVRLAASELLGVELLPTMLESLRTDHPMLSIELALSDRVEDLIEHEADIAIRTVKPTHDSLIARRLGVSKVGLYAKPEFLEANGEPRSLEQLRECPLITPDRASDDWATLLQLGYPSHSAKVVLRADNHLAQLAAVRSGLGIGPCHGMLAKRYQLTRVLEQDFNLDVDVWIAMPESSRNIARVTAVFRCLANAMSDLLAES